MPEQRKTLTLQQAIDLGVQHHKEGRLSQAEAIYNQILQTNPEQPVALHLLGVIAHQRGRNDTAVDLITKAIAIEPYYAEANNNLGLALQDLGRLDEAAGVVRTPCSHSFCSGCLVSALVRCGRRCPLCRRDLRLFLGQLQKRSVAAVDLFT